MSAVYYNERLTATLFDAEPHQRIKPFKEFEKKHDLDILDISWYPKDPYENYLLTAGEKKVIVWNLNERGPIQILAHANLVSCAIFNVSQTFCIASGCYDKTIRLWRINTRTVTSWQQTTHFITALQYNQNGTRLVAGLVNGEVHVYDSSLTDSLQHLTKIECRNRTGKFSKGKKVTGIEFMSETMPNCMMVTTNDNRIRFINIKNGKVLLKMKGPKNENYVIRASLTPDYSHAICASEDGAVYLWNNIEQTVLESSKRGLIGKMFATNKVKEYEYFSMNQPSSADPVNLDTAKRFSDESSNSSDNSNQSPKTNTAAASTTSSAIGSGTTLLCQAVFAPKGILDTLNEQKNSNSGMINMVIVVSNCRGEVSVLMNQTSIT